MLTRTLTTIVSCLLAITLSFGQTDTILFQLQSEVEFTPNFSAYSGTFDQQNADYLYVACKELGLLFFQINGNGALIATDTIPPAALNGHFVSNVCQEGEYLYLALGNFQGSNHQPGLGIVNVSNPSIPVIESVWDTTFTHGSAIVKVLGNYAYLGLMDDGLLIMDVTDKSAPTFVSHLELDVNFPMPPGLFSMPHARGLALTDQYAYVCNDAGALRVVNIEDKEQPEEVGQHVNTYIKNNAARAYNNIVLAGDIAFVGVDYCGVEVIDISNPESPTTISLYNPWDCSPTNWADGTGHVNELMVDESQALLFVSAGDSDLLVLDYSNPEALQEIGRFGNTLDSIATWGIAIRGQQVALFEIDNSPVPNWIPQPFYSEYGGVRLLEWERLPTSIPDIESVAQIRVFPNPASDFLTVEHELAEPVAFKLFNALGHLIFKEKLSDRKVQISTVNWPGGYYFYQILNEQGQQLGRERIYIQHP